MEVESLLLLKTLLRAAEELSRDNSFSKLFGWLAKKVVGHPGEKHICGVKCQAFILILCNQAIPIILANDPFFSSGALSMVLLVGSAE